MGVSVAGATVPIAETITGRLVTVAERGFFMALVAFQLGVFAHQRVLDSLSVVEIW